MPQILRYFISSITEQKVMVGKTVRNVSPADCSCNICIWQPPSLLASASHSFQSRFQSRTVSTDCKHNIDQYVYALQTKGVRVSLWKLLPPGFPVIRVIFRFHNHDHKLHFDCPVRGSWQAEYTNVFESPQAFKEFVKDKNMYWRSFCEKPLFFPSACQEHLA